MTTSSNDSNNSRKFYTFEEFKKKLKDIFAKHGYHGLPKNEVSNKKKTKTYEIKFFSKKK